MNRTIRALLVFVATTASLLTITSTAEADETASWSLVLDGPATVTSGENLAVRIERDAPGPEVSVRLYLDERVVSTVTLARSTTDWREIVAAPRVSSTTRLTLRVRDGSATWSNAVAVTVTAPPAPKVGPNGFRKSAALDEAYLMSTYRWSPCRAIPVRVTNRSLIGPARAAVRTLRDLTGFRLHVTTKPLPGYGIRIVRTDLPGRVAGMGGMRAVDHQDRATLGRVRIDIPAAGRHLTGVLTHELAHALGVDHSPRSSGDLMSPAGSSYGATSWERRALRYAGQGAC